MIHTVIPCVLVLFMQEGRVLLLRRHNAHFGNGLFSIVGGKVDAGESVSHAAIRESLEEVGLDVKSENLEFVHALHKSGECDEIVCFVFKAHDWQGTPVNREPHKHDLMEWFALDCLPENILPTHRDVLGHMQRGVLFSEFGF